MCCLNRGRIQKIAQEVSSSLTTDDFVKQCRSLRKFPHQGLSNNFDDSITCWRVLKVAQRIILSPWFKNCHGHFALTENCLLISRANTKHPVATTPHTRLLDLSTCKHRQSSSTNTHRTNNRLGTSCCSYRNRMIRLAWNLDRGR